MLDSIQQLLPLILTLLVLACKSPAVDGVVRHGDLLTVVGGVQLRPGLVQVGQVEGGHVREGGGVVGGVVELDQCLILLHASPLPVTESWS